MDRPRHRLLALLVLAAIILLGFSYHGGHLRDMPAYGHAWAQADRYALVLGFQRNGFDLFRPETFTLNHQFPGNYRTADATSITGVDLPLHEYAVALLMATTGWDGPWLFHVYALAWSFIGLFFLYKLAVDVSDDPVKAWLVVLFAATAPAYLYYQDSFLPTMPSLSCAIIGIRAWLRADPGKGPPTAAVVFLTLAALTRTTFIMTFLAAMLVDLHGHRRSWTEARPRLVAWVIGLAVLAASWWHKRALTQAHGSMFLDQLVPARSWKEAAKIGSVVKDQWILQWFSGYHYALFGLVALAALVLQVRGRARPYRLARPLLHVLVLMLGAACLFAVAMWQQFEAHDYYFLDSFYLPVLLLLVFLLSLAPPVPRGRLAWSMAGMLVAGATLPMVLNGFRTQEARMATGPWNRAAATISGFRGAAALLDSLGSPRTDKVLVLNAVAPNLPFLFLQRKGYAVLTDRPADMVRALGWHPDLVVYLNADFFSTTYPAFPEITHYLERIADNGRITLCKPVVSDPRRDLYRFFGSDRERPLLKAELRTRPDGVAWQTGAMADDTSGLKVRLSPEQDYAFGYRTDSLPGPPDRPGLLHVSWSIRRHDLKHCELVITLRTHGEPELYRAADLNPSGSEPGVWERQEAYVEVPPFSRATALDLYVWNPGGSRLELRDVHLTFHRRRS
jgi:hypothetical protein